MKQPSTLPSWDRVLGYVRRLVKYSDEPAFGQTLGHIVVIENSTHHKLNLKNHGNSLMILQVEAKEAEEHDMLPFTFGIINLRSGGVAAIECVVTDDDKHEVNAWVAESNAQLLTYLKENYNSLFSAISSANKRRKVAQ